MASFSEISNLLVVWDWPYRFSPLSGCIVHVFVVAVGFPPLQARHGMTHPALVLTHIQVAIPTMFNSETCAHCRFQVMQGPSSPTFCSQSASFCPSLSCVSRALLCLITPLQSTAPISSASCFEQKTAASMISDGRLFATISQVTGSVTFASRKDDAAADEQAAFSYMLLKQ